MLTSVACIGEMHFGAANSDCRHGPDMALPLSAAALASQPALPCASLLLRLVPTPRSAAGLALSMADVPREEVCCLHRMWRV